MKKSEIIRWLIYVIGIGIMSIGISLTVWAAVLGVSPWDSFHLGLTNYLPLNFGQITQLVGAFAIVIGMFLGVKPKVGTILNMILVGWLVNIILYHLPANIVNEYSVITFIVFIFGIMNYGMGTALYIYADTGMGPRDSIMVGLNRKFGISIGLARTILEVTVVCLAFLLSGPVGIGTVIFSLTIGFSVEKSSNFIKKFKILQFEQVDQVKRQEQSRL